jgi:GntR family transcriptional regulator / MocR family aminotransferase
VPIVIPLSKPDGALYRQIYSGLRSAILGGSFGPGDRLPSTRSLAEQLGVSRTVVLLAYELLLAEGFAQGAPGSGTYVSEGLRRNPTAKVEAPAQLRLSHYGATAAAIAATLDFPQRHSTSLRYDFAYGRGDATTFPFETWRRILLKHARATPIHGLNYGTAAGVVALREAIALHLRRSRAVACDPSQVIVVNGSQQALDLIARVLIDPGDRVAIEDPQYQGTREVLRTVRARLHPVPIDGEGLDPAHLPKNSRIVFVTPSHQFPTGVILPLARRWALLAWARANEAIVVEDDYDGEFRYEGQPLESLQGLDTEGRVIYTGTFSRTVFSALRIGYLVVPSSLIRAFTAAKWLCDRHTATLEQETLAEFIATGMYERHLRRLRRNNTERRQALLAAIGKHLRGEVELTGDGAGAHVVLWPKKRILERTAIRRAAQRGVGIYGLSGYFIGRAQRPGLLLGYSQMNVEEIREGIRRLGGIFSP